MHAAETAYQGTIAYKAYNQSTGTRKVGEIDYDWHVNLESICVLYEWNNEVFTKCIDYDS